MIFKSIIASFDQAILSALSFIISIVLIKTVSKVDYGYYAIGFSIALFLISIQNAIVNTPLAILLVSKKDNVKKKYTASLFYGQFIVILPVAFIGISAAAMAFSMGFDSLPPMVFFNRWFIKFFGLLIDVIHCIIWVAKWNDSFALMGFYSR